jgi:hypothetical protein
MILIQVGIVAALIVFYKVGMPKYEAARERAAVAEREQAITSFFESESVESGGAGPAGGGQHKRLRKAMEVNEVEQQLGAPDQTLTAYGGGQHLTWTGTRHRLRASFERGQLYALTMTDLESGHGEVVYESSAQWHAF